MKSFKQEADVSQSIKPAAYTATVTGSSVDAANYDEAMVVIDPGTITDGTHTPKLQESADNSTFTDVAAADLDGAFAAIATATVQKVGYIGRLRYLRVVSTVASATTGGVYSATLVLGGLRKRP